MKGSSIVDNVLIAIGLIYAISDIESILGIIILVIQIIWILVKAIIKIYHSIKDKNISGVKDSIKDLHDDLTDIQDQLKEDKDGKR